MLSRLGGELRRKVFFGISILVLIISHTGDRRDALAAPGADSAPRESQPTLLERPLAAQPPSVSLNLPAEAFPGSNVTFTVTFDNPDPSDAGYGPLIDLIIPTSGPDGAPNPDGLTFVNATYLGVNVERTVITVPPSGVVTHPYMRDASGAFVTVTGLTPGDTFVALRLPFGSFTPDQPPVTVNVETTMSNWADVGTPLTIRARGGYQFGYTPLDDWCCGDDPSLTLTSWVNGSVTPILFTLSKSYSGPEDETATGPNFPRQYTVTAQIAPGQTMTAFNLTDTLPANMQFLSLVSTNPSGANCTLPSTSTPGGTLSCDFGAVSGTVSMTFEYYIPLRDSGGSSVINPSSGDDAPSCNNASSGGNWTPLDPRDTGGTFTQNPAGCEHTLTDKSIAIHKSVSVVGGGNPAPGKYLEYTLDFQVSDFFAFQNVVVTDVISDGQHFDPAFVPTLQINGNTYTLGATGFNAANYDVACHYTGGGSECETNTGPFDGTTTLVFRVSDEIIARGQDGRLIGGCVPTTGTGGGDPDCGAYDDGPTTGRLVFRTLIQQDFTDDYPSGDPSVDQGDTLDNTVSVSGDVLNTANASTPTGFSEDDSSTAGVSIGRGALTKDIYAVNGSTSFSKPVEVKPGDTVTFRLTYTLPTGDVENLYLHDYLPMPVFRVNDPDADGTSGPAWTFVTGGGIPAAGVATFGPSDTFYAYSGIVPTLSTSGVNNRLEFTYGDFDGPTEQTYTADILFTITVSSDPFADRLYLTNQANAFEGSTNAGTAEANAIVQMILTEPVLRISKGVVWTNNPNGQFTPATVGPVTFDGSAATCAGRLGGMITSSGLAANPVNSNLANVDAGDTIMMAILIENTGHASAFDVTVSDSLLAGMSFVSGSLCVTDGTGATFTYSGNLFSGGITLDDPGPTTTPPGALDPGRQNNTVIDNGHNIAVITYLVTLDSNIQSGTSLTNTAILSNYAGTESGPNHVPGGLTDTANVQVRTVGLGKIFTTEIIHSVNSLTQAVIGELVTYTLIVTVPEGVTPQVTVEDNLPTGMAFVDCVSVTPLSGGNPTNDLTTDLSGGFSAACNDPSNPTVNPGGQSFTFNLGTLTNANTDNSVDETLQIQFQAVVLNVLANQAGESRVNQATLRIQGGAGGVANVSSAPLTIIEPLVNTTKSVVPSSGDAGDTVTFTVTLTNPATGSTTAYDVTWSDTLPSGLIYVPGSLTLGACAVDTSLTLSDAGAPTLTGSGGLFQPGQSCTITFQATIDYGVAPGQVITNTAETRWTSLSGNVTDRSPYNADSDERTGADGVGGALNDYASQGQAEVTINSVAPIKSIVATSEAHTGVVSGVERVAIGEIVRYRLVVQLPEGTSVNFQIQDLLPGGLTYLDDGTAKAAFVSNGAGITSNNVGTLPVPAITDSDCFLSGNSADGTNPPIPAVCDPLSDNNVGSTSSTSTDVDAYGTGTDPYFKLGTLTNNDSDADAEYVIVEFNALVDNTAPGSNDAGDSRYNSFRVLISGTQNGPNSTSVQVIIAEPSLSLSKTAAIDTTRDAGDTVTYTLTISAASGPNRATAFDLTLTDAFDSYLTGLSVTNVTTTQGATCVGNGGGTTAFSHNSGSFAGSTLTFTATCLDPGQSITLTVTGTVAAGAPAGYTIPNTANLTYTSLPGTGTSPNPTGSTTPGGSGAPNGERDGSGGVNDYLASSSAPLNLSVPQIVKQAPTPAGYPIGATVTYPILITLPEGVTRNVRITDQVPAGMQYVSYSLDTAAFNGSFANNPPHISGGTTNGDDVTFDFGDITTTNDNNTNNNAFTLYVTLRVLDVTGNAIGTVLTNSATLTYTPGTGATDSTIDGGTQNITVLEPILTTTKSVNPASNVQAGDTLTYTVRFANTGTATAYDLTAEDTLAQGVTYNNDAACVYFDGNATTPIGVTVTVGSGTLTFDGNPSGTWDIPATDPDSYIECTYTVTAQNSLHLDGSHTNTVDADWSSLNGVDSNERVYDDSVNRPGVDGTQDTASATFTSPAPTFDKSNGVAEAVIGQTYTVTLTLTSPLGTLRSLTISDVLPAGLVYVTGSQSVSGGISPVPTFSVSAPNDGSAPVTLTWNFGDAVVSSSPVTITYTVRVANVAGNQNGTDLTNTATLTYTDAQGNGQSRTDTDTLTVREPELDLQKTVDSTTPAYGQTLTYTLTVSHLASSTATAYDLVITDLIPSGLTYVSGSITAPAGCTADDTAAPTLTWTCASLPVGNTLILTYQATVNDPPGPPNPGDTLTNNASLDWTSLAGSDSNERDGSGGINDYSDSTSQNVTLYNPDLTITKTDGQTSYVPGTSVTYTIVVSNVGNGDAIGATVSDTRPSEVTSWTWVCTDQSGGASGCDSYSGSGDFNDVVNLPAGASITYTVTASIASSATGDLVNTVTVTPPAGVTDPTPADNTATDTDTPDIRSDLSINKDDGVTVVAPGSVITYTITVSNAGPSDAAGAQVSDSLPPQIASWTWACASSSGGASGCDGDNTNPAVFTDTVNLPAGSSITYQVTATVANDASGTLTNTVSVQPPAGVTDPDPSGNDDDDVDSIVTIPTGDFTKSLVGTNQGFTPGSSVAIGEMVTYELTFTVPAGGNMPNLTLTDILDRGLAFVGCDSITSSSVDVTTDLVGGFAAACNDPTNPTVAIYPSGSTNPADPGRQVIFTLGNVSNTGTADGFVTIRYRAVVLDTVENQDGVWLNNAATLSWASGSLAASADEVRIVEPDFWLTKDADRRVVPPGSVITFTLRFGHTAQSRADAFDVVLTDVLPAGLTYVPGTLVVVSGPAGGTVDDSAAPTLRVTWASFPRDEQAEVQFQATLGDLAPGQRAQNTAALEWTSLPGDVTVPQSAYNDTSTERYYDPGSDVNVYGTVAQVTISVPALPATGFAPGRETIVPPQPAGQEYVALGNLWLEIPKLGLKVPIVGVPLGSSGGWDLTWLSGQVGWLEGTAFPTWRGNSALTAHVYLANGLPGPFFQLDTLFWGDTIIVHFGGQRYIYAVRQVRKVWPEDLSVLRHEEYPWLTLITCREYDEKSGTYRYRVVVRAVQIKVESDK